VEKLFTIGHEGNDDLKTRKMSKQTGAGQKHKEGENLVWFDNFVGDERFEYALIFDTVEGML
jgi:hypothetical protein